MNTATQESKKILSQENKRLVIELIKNSMVFIALVVLFMIFSITLSHVGNGFSSPDNLWNIIRQTSLIAILSVGMSFALAAGQIDLSMGAVVAVTGLISALVLRSYGIIPAIFAGLSVGVAVGALNRIFNCVRRYASIFGNFGNNDRFSGCCPDDNKPEINPHYESDVYQYFWWWQPAEYSCTGDMDDCLPDNRSCHAKENALREEGTGDRWKSQIRYVLRVLM